MQQDREWKETLDRLLLLIYELKGFLPRDSVQEVECSCHFRGLMEIDTRQVSRNRAGLAFAFQCPQCGTRTPYQLDLPLKIRMAHLANRFRTGSRSILKNNRRKFLALGLVALALGAAATEYKTHGFRLLITRGPREALAWIREPHTDREKFVKAWTYYSDGHLLESRELVRKVLRSENLDRKTRADALYLQGLLRDKQGTPSSLDTFQQAAAIYSDLGKETNVQQVYITIAQSMFTREDLELAENYLNLALSMEVSPENPNWGYYYETEAKLHFGRRAYAQALDSSLMGLDYYKTRGDVNGQARCLSDAGFYHILLGDLEEGLRNSIAAEKIILESGNTDLYFFNKINFYLHAKCSDQNVMAYTHLLDEKVSDTGDRLLKKFVKFAREFQCVSSVVVGDGESPPPPD